MIKILNLLKNIILIFITMPVLLITQLIGYIISGEYKDDKD